MEHVQKEILHEVEIYDYTGESYQTAMAFGHWKIAYLNHADYFSEETLARVERHNETDEAFILLEGEATLVVGTKAHRIPMERYKIYNVPKGVWHHILTVAGTRVLIVENEDTGELNSDFYDL